MKAVLSFVALCLVSSSAFAAPTRPVQVGGDPSLDACGGSGVILATTTLFRMDKSGYLKFDTAQVNQSAAVCDEEDGYVGVVFSEKGNDCGVGSSIEKRQDYKGPCKSGWIKKTFFELLAG